MNQPRRQRRLVPTQDRQRLVDCHEDGGDIIELADRLGINHDTDRSIIRVWMDEGRVEAKPLGGVQNVRVDEEMLAEIFRLARENPFTTLVQIQDQLRAAMPEKPRIHNSTIARHLQNQLISMKIAGKDADVPRQRNTNENKQKRYAYAEWLAHLPLNAHIIYIDECGFNLFTRRRQARSAVGERVRRQVKGICGRNINLILAISAEYGLMSFEMKQETLNHEKYQRFINNLIVAAAPHYANGDFVYLVHDGARPHLNTIVNEPHQRQFFIVTQPPYSPFFNPVEQAHSCFKAAVSRAEIELTDG